MKIVLGIDAINIRGGGIVHLKNIINQRKYIKFDKIIIWGNKEVLSNIKYNSKIKKIYNKNFDRKLLFRFFWQLLFFKNSIKKNKVNCMFYLSGFFLKKITTSVVFFQNILPFYPEIIKEYNIFKRIKFYFQKLLFLNSAKKSNFVIFPSLNFQKIFQLYDKNMKYKSSIIYHGAEKKFIKNNRKDKIISIFPSSFQKFKNHKKLIEAISILKNKNKFSLDLYGPGNKKEIKQVIYKIEKINGLNKIIKYKGQKDYNYIFENYNLLIYPSKCESFGLPLLESALSGLKVACSDIPIFREILGKYAFYFNPNSSKSIANCLYKISRKKINKKNIIKLKNKFNWNDCSKKTFRLLYKITLNEKKNIINYK